jgi:hypothetical protein
MENQQLRLQHLRLIQFPESQYISNPTLQQLAGAVKRQKFTIGMLSEEMFLQPLAGHNNDIRREWLVQVFFCRCYFKCNI